MSTRDELVKILATPRMHTNGSLDKHRATADALIAEGWRKKPNEAELEDVIQRHWEGWTGRESQDFCTIVATSVLALMDRGQ